MGRQTFKKVITTPELLEKIHPKNQKLVDQFLREKSIRSSNGTIRGYKSDLDIFFCWNFLHNENKIFFDIRKLEFSEFFYFCVDELKWSSSRFNRMKSCLSSLSNFIEKFFDDDYPEFRNVILKVVESLPKKARREKTILSEEQIDNLFDYLENKLQDYQMTCWLALAIGSGARFSELLRFTTDIIDFDNIAFEGIFLETTRTIKTKGRGKNGKLVRKYIIRKIFEERYMQWISVRSTILKENNKDHNFLFIKNNGDPAREGTVRTWIEKMGKFLQVNLYAHSLRHFTATYLASKGLPYELIKEIFGWSSIEMCSLYDDATAKDKEWVSLTNLK